MPVMDGEEAMRRIRELPGGRKVKIVAVTASAFSEQQNERLDAGMDDFVSKPYRSGEIYACLSRQLDLRFLYEGAVESQELPRTVAPDKLSALPETSRCELREALESLEGERIGQVIEQVAAYDRDLWEVLSQFAGNFDYLAILKALRAD
jgi:CheY-like chemotaxis protein